MSITLIPETNQEARALFWDSGLTYGDIDKRALDVLLAFLDIELASCRLNPKTSLQGSMRMQTEIVSVAAAAGGISEAYLFVDGPYFKEREAISFNDDGFIGIAGWADSKNVRPFLVAFGQWVEWMANREITNEG